MKSIHALILVLTASASAADLNLKKDILFYAPFESKGDAAFAKGDARLRWAPQMKFPPAAQLGLPPSGSITIEKNAGRFGDALRFHEKSSEMVFFYEAGNTGYNQTNWNGTVSFWLKLSPDEDLQPGFTDPIQITSKSWDNAAFFVEFSKDEKPREFRLGVYADKNVWNPDNRDWNAIPMKEKPLVPVIRPPFNRQKWTHIAYTYENFNTGKTNGVAKLYLDGKLQGQLTPREMTFTWEKDKALIMLGLSYIGLFDELAIFGKALPPSDIAALHDHPEALR